MLFAYDSLDILSAPILIYISFLVYIDLHAEEVCRYNNIKYRKKLEIVYIDERANIARGLNPNDC
jgi:hypothetical protein